MKKNVTLLSMLFTVGASIAQIAPGLYTGKAVETTNTHSTDKATGDVIWSTNFDYSANWSSTAIGATPATDYGWQISPDRASAKTWYLTNGMNSTSKGAMAYCENGDPRTGSTVPVKPNTEWILTLDSTFNFTAFPNVLLQFEQFGARFYDYQAVEVSNDGGVTWKEVGNNEDMARLSNTGGAAYPNPQLRTYNVSEAFPGAPLDNFRIRFRVYWPSAQSGVMYGWVIDDLKFVEGASYDVTLTNFFFSDVQKGFEHTSIPKQAAKDYPLNLQAVVKNNSVLDPSSATLKYSIKTPTGTVITSGTGGSLSNNFAAQTDTINYVTGFDLSTLEIGTYVLEAVVSLPNETDEVAANDTLRRSFEITDGYLGQQVFEESILGGNIGKALGTGGNSAPLTFGNVMYIPKNTYTTGLEVFIANTATYPTTVDGDIEVVLFEYNPNATTNADIMVEQDGARSFVLKSDLIPASGASGMVLFDFNQVSDGEPGPVALEGGKFYMLAVRHFGGAANHIAYGQNVSDEDNSSFIYGPFGAGGATAYFSNSAQIITRMKLENNVGVAEKAVKTNTNAYPNPFNHSTDILVNLKTNATVGVVVTDMTGRVVYTATPAQMNQGQNKITIEGAALNAGVYNCAITVDNEVFTTRIVKK